jgi:hypothetical protein
VNRRRPTLLALVCVAAGLALAVPPGAAAAAHKSAAARPVTVDVTGPRRVSPFARKLVTGRIGNPGTNENVFVTVRASGRKLFTKRLRTNPSTGRFRMPLAVGSCCRYTVGALHNGARARPARFTVVVPKKIGRGNLTKKFNRLLQRRGFHQAGASSHLNWSSHLALLAFRKTNGMSRNGRYAPGIFRSLLQGRGEFEPRYKDGRHVEVDLSRQVMAFIVGDQAVQVFHVSTGKPSTPTVRGKFRFYLRQPGYNAELMYYSIYFHGGYATHGYDPVPTYPASHGCVRNPIPFSIYIYRWVQIGMPIYLYG